MIGAEWVVVLSFSSLCCYISCCLFWIFLLCNKQSQNQWLKATIYFAHNCGVRNLERIQNRQFNSDPHASAGVVRARGYPSKMAFLPTCLKFLSTQAPFCGLDFFQHGGVELFILLPWQVVSKRPRQTCQYSQRP